jgi:metal-responsive CopG/Arc/MetJ family transcriptional regulator
MTPVERTRTERLQVVLAADVIAAVDEFRFDTRKPSRAAAVRELLRRGLENEDQLPEPARPKR